MTPDGGPRRRSVSAPGTEGRRAGAPATDPPPRSAPTATSTTGHVAAPFDPPHPGPVIGTPSHGLAPPTGPAVPIVPPGVSAPLLPPEHVVRATLTDQGPPDLTARLGAERQGGDVEEECGPAPKRPGLQISPEWITGLGVRPPRLASPAGSDLPPIGRLEHALEQAPPAPTDQPDGPGDRPTTAYRSDWLPTSTPASATARPRAGAFDDVVASLRRSLRTLESRLDDTRTRISRDPRHSTDTRRTNESTTWSTSDRSRHDGDSPEPPRFAGLGGVVGPDRSRSVFDDHSHSDDAQPDDAQRGNGQLDGVRLSGTTDVVDDAVVAAPVSR